MIIFLIIPLILMTINIYFYFCKKISTSFFASIAIWCAILFAVTEGLSLFYKLTFKYVSAFWVTFSIVLLFPIIFYKHKKDSFKDLINKLKNAFKNNKVFTFIIIAFCILMISLSIRTVPYNWDSMTYHLPRIMTWLSNQNVNHFATNISRQLDSPPLSEFINTHVYLLSDNSDIYFNVLQCLSYLISGFIIFKIAKKIGCSNLWAKAAMILFYAMPIAFAEAFTTQVDNLATMILLIFVYCIIDFFDKNKKLELNKESILKIICLGITLGLCYISKPTVIIAAAIFTIYLIFVCVRRKDKLKYILISILIVITITGVIITPEILKNYKTYNSISSPSVGTKQIVGTLDFRYVLVNFLKNFAFNLPTRYIDKSSEYVINPVIEIAKNLQININDETIAENGMQYRAYPPNKYDHDSAINPSIVWLLIVTSISGFIYCIIKKKKFSDIFGSYYFLSYICFVLFMFIVRWEIWETRYEIAYLALLCPAVCKLFESMCSNKKNISMIIIGIIFFISVTNIYNMYLYHNEIADKMSEDRMGGYFYNRTNVFGPYKQITDVIKINGYRNIGLKIDEDDYEYPIWKLLNGFVDEIWHVDIKNNKSSMYEKDELPDCIILNKAEKELVDDQCEYKGQTYHMIKEVNDFCLLVK